MFTTPRAVVRINGFSVDDIKEYSYTSDLLQLGDPFSFTVPNIGGKYTKANSKTVIQRGASVQFYIADPAVQQGNLVLKATGLVISRERFNNHDGSSVRVTCADLGWHLNNNSAPLWMNLRGHTYRSLAEKLIDPSWGFQGTREGNSLNRRLKKGRFELLQELTPNLLTVMPRIQVEPGEQISETLIRYAKRLPALLNVSGDGWFQIFQPNYTQAASYQIQLHEPTDPRSKTNNIKDAHEVLTIEPQFNDVVCVGTQVYPPVIQDHAVLNPNQLQFVGREKRTIYPFRRYMTFSDPEPLTTAQARTRARWRANRGDFDAEQWTYTVAGHSQNGVFWETDTIVAVNDSVNDIYGNFYVSAVSYSSTRGNGSETRITVRLPNKLVV